MPSQDSDRQQARKGDPTVAVLLTWFVPGAGHWYLGRTVQGCIMLAVIGGLYYLGVTLSEGLFLEYLPPEMRGRFAGALTPEVGNLGGLILHLRAQSYLPSPREWPTGMDMGTTLTATSGVLNLFVMAHAHSCARQPRAVKAESAGENQAARSAGWMKLPAVAAAFTWVLPGLGHVLQGRKLRGLMITVLLVGLFAVGCLLAEGVNLDRERHFYYWAGQFLLGGPAIIAEFLNGHPRVVGDLAYADAGVVIGCIAGMLNVLCMLDAFGYAEDQLQGQQQLGASEEDQQVASAGATAADGDSSTTGAESEPSDAPASSASSSALPRGDEVSA